VTTIFNPPHPGELLDDYLDGLSIAEAARRLGVTRATLSRIRHGHAAVTADMALRFADLFGTSAEYWLTMQTAYDLWTARSRRPAVLAQDAARSGPIPHSAPTSGPSELPN
jgi:addiction module HigA family antidote